MSFIHIYGFPLNNVNYFSLIILRFYLGAQSILSLWYYIGVLHDVVSHLPLFLKSSILLDWGEIFYFTLVPGYLILQKDINFWVSATWFYKEILISGCVKTVYKVFLEERHEGKTNYNTQITPLPGFVQC